VQEFDLVVIGGGSAGLKAARTAARLGRTVALAEERELGGECFWAGCVPTKAMVRAAQVWHLARRAHEFGIHLDIRKAEFADAMAYKANVLRRIAGDGPADGGLSRLGAAYFPLRASFEGPHEVRVGQEVIRGKQIIVATGTVPSIPSIPGLTETGFITNREAVDLETLPKRLVVLGAGPIGLEFAQVFRRFGAEVTIIERSAHILPREDEEIAALSAEFLAEEGIRILTNAVATEVKAVHDSSGGPKRLHVRQKEQTHILNCDEILVATGRNAAVAGLNVEAAGIAFDQKRVQVDRYLRTSVPHIWAAGDISGGYLFTHVASYEGKLAAMNAFTDKPESFDHRVVPRATYVDPEVASIGLTEREAQEQGAQIVVQSFSFADLDRAILHGEPRGLVKLIVDALDGQILGAHLTGPDASSVLAELAVCMKNHLPVSAIADTMHAYPSFPEAVEAAALSAPNYRGQVEGATG
jgi:pyruvate/2-oxoglutarate dehydrogenase complex dihydrolipoamide dehydrogenase (E3) component